jgi:hypothetical protein
MKHFSHLVSADVRRFRMLLGMFVVILIADAVFRGVRPMLAADPRLATALDLLGAVLFVTRWLGFIVIVPLVVQTHPLVGSDAFWMTRPIPRRALFASKVVLLWTTCVAVAAACEAALMLASRMPASAIASVAFQSVLLQSLSLFILMALASTTRNLARFALVTGSVLVALVLLIYIAIAVMIRSMPAGPQLTEVTGRTVPSPTGGVVLVVLITIAAIVQLVVQYRTRSTRASVCAGVAGFAIAFMTPELWPSHERLLPVPDWAGRESALRLIAESPRGEFRPTGDGSPFGGFEGWQTGGIRLSVSSVEESWLVTVRLRDATVAFDDGTTLSTAANGYSWRVPGVAMRQALGVRRVVGAPTDPPVDTTMPAIVLTQADFNRHSGSTATYRGRFVVDLDHIEIAATLPLRAGAEFRDRRHRIVTDRVALQGRGASIRLRQLTATSMLDAGTIPHLSFYLRNRDTSEAVAGSTDEGMSTSLAPFFFGGVSTSGPVMGFSASGHFIRFPDHYGAVEERFEITTEWLSQAEMVIVRTVPAGSVTITLEVPDFEIEAAPRRSLR